jgi:enoyl-CoA hydratase
LIIHKMQAFRSTARVASQFRASGLPRFVRGYASAKQYEHVLVSSPKPGVGFSKYFNPIFLKIGIL